MKRVLVTGSSGLVGSEAVRYFDARGWQVVGIDNNLRMECFGPEGDTTRNLTWLKENTQRFEHQNVDIRSRRAIGMLLARERFDLILHCAARPLPDSAGHRPLDDFDVNAGGTMNLLEAARQSCPASPFVTMSTNRVYGDAPGRIPVLETDTRYDYARPEDRDGVDETCRIDTGTHGIFGATKFAADVMTQEYGRSFNMPTCVLRAGCVTGSRQAGVRPHGFLNHLVQTAARGDRYTIIGHKGKQVCDPLHALDVVRAMHAFAQAPRAGEVYNLGGGRENSISTIESLARVERVTGRAVATEYQPVNAPGDHPCYITNLAKFRSHYPQWSVSLGLDDILEDLLGAVRVRESGVFRNGPRPDVPVGI